VNVATHEAAHAVVGLLLGEDVEKVTIVPDGPVLGSAKFVSFPDDRKADYEARLRAQAIASLAGLCAHPEGCDGDRESAEEAAFSLGGSEESISRLYAQWKVEAKRMLEENARRVDAVRAALEQHGTLTGAQVQAILDATL
jgi:ATP-dependent Zn protease